MEEEKWPREMEPTETGTAAQLDVQDAAARVFVATNRAWMGMINTTNEKESSN